MIYKTNITERTVNIKCTLEEYNSKEFQDNIKCAIRQKADKIVVEVDNKDWRLIICKEDIKL